MNGNLKSFDAVEADHQNQKDSTISKDAVEQEQAIEGTKPYDFYKNNKQEEYMEYRKPGKLVKVDSMAGSTKFGPYGESVGSFCTCPFPAFAGK